MGVRHPSSNLAPKKNDATLYFHISNLGARWTFDWLSFIEDDPTALGQLVDLYVRGGGREGYDIRR